MTDDHPVVVLHAYDARNRGDGLLVAETLRLLGRAGVRKEDCVVVASDAKSFETYSATFQYPGFGTRGVRRLLDSLTIGVLAAAGQTSGRLAQRTRLGQLVNRASLVVGVGGGYLQAPGGERSRLSGLVHVPQLALAAQARGPSIYLSQSIGPLKGPVGASIRRHLARIDVVLARDDVTIREVPEARARRFPDLAVLKIARELELTDSEGRGKRTVGIARTLAAPGYVSRLKQLGDLVPIEWTVHSRASGQDDAEFYDLVGLEWVGSSADMLARPEVGVVVSVRLHGALQAIVAGIPAIHLSYERKGMGAYSDLGLEEWVHEADSFSPRLVAEQSEALLRNPSRYWSRIRERADKLRDREEEIVREIGTLRGRS